MILIILSKLYYRSRNARREEIWGRMSEGDRASYLETTTDEGNKRCVATLELFVLMLANQSQRLDFRFVH